MLRIHAVILDLVRATAPTITRIAESDSDLARQLRRALCSVPLNTAEAGDQRGARKGNHYSIALGSAREASAAILVAEALGYIEAPSSSLTNHVIGTLVKLAYR